MRVVRLPGRRRTTSVAAVVTVPAVVATLALINPGFPLAQVDLNDGAAWVTSTSTLQLGRYNAQVEELNAGLVADGATFDVLQDGSDVLLVEPESVSVVDPTSVTMSAQVPLPAGSTVAMGGGTVAIVAADGRVWVRAFADLGALQPGTDQPDADLGDGALVTVTAEGEALAVDAGTGDVTRITPGGDEATGAVSATARSDGSLGGPVESITSVGSQPVGLDGRIVRTLSGAVEVDLSRAVLQQPGPDSGQVVIAGSEGVVEVDLSSPRVAAEHEAGGGGTPAAPVRVGSCVHAAWPTTTANYLLLCDGQDPQVADLAGMTTADTLAFRVNRQVVVLNETLHGRLWLPLEDTAVREPNWSDIIPEDQPEQDDQVSDGDQTTQQLVPDCSTTSAPPTAADDAFGVRAGRSTLLSVIDNDSSSDCGILVISDFDPVPPEFGTLQAVQGGRALQLTVAPGATGSATFSYTITDGRGTAAPSTAQVTLTVRGPELDDPPVQLRTGTLRVEQGGQATYPVLADFRDPDGDDLVLVGASAEQGTARFRQDGTLTYVADGGSLGRTTVHVSVSDGTHTTDGTLEVDVRAAGSLPPQIDPVHAVAYVDQTVELRPLDAVRSSSAEPARLASVEELAGTTITSDLDAGTFTFSAPRAGTYYVSFVVTAAPQEATGLARIDVKEWPAEAQPPVAQRDEAYLPLGGEVTVAPLANDIDPGGGVLVLQSVDGGEDSGLRVAVMNHELVQISALRDLPGPVTLTYQVSNGTASTTGEIAVIPVPASASSQPPVVPDASADVRTGGVVTIPVLADAYDPDGDALTLVPEFAEPLADGQGLLFVSGDVLRYQAPDTPMTARATFVVRDSTGNETAATVTLRVHTSDADTKSPPRPKDLVARTFSGETVRISVPLVGIDSDGDGVTLLGVATAPTKGRVTDVGADWLEYQALPGEVGTDEFTYAVEDWTGQRAVATVRVGLAERPSDSNQVLARNDFVTVRPGQRVEVRVLANDIDSSGGQLEIADNLEVPDGVDARVEDRRVVVQAPATPGLVQIVYTAENARGGQSSAVLTVTVDPDAVVLPPIAQDVVVPPIDTIGRTSVDVDVLSLAQNPSGPLSDLEVSIPRSAQDVAAVTSDGRVRVTLTDQAQTLPYLLTNTSPDANGIGTYAFITVPALGFFPPTARPRAPELRVLSGEQLVIPLDEQVQVAPGRTAQVADASAVTATRSDGSSLVADGTTVQFRSAAGYVGPASITVPVTDRTSAGDTTARTSVITLPITVYTLDDHPPTFSPSAIDLEPGEAPRGVDLQAFTQGVDGQTGVGNAYTYRLTSPAPAGFTVSLDGSRLSASAAPGTPKGTRATVQLALGYGRAGSMDVQVELRVVASSRFTAVVPDRTVTDGVQGQSTTVDILAGVRNPFPEEALRIVGVSVETPGTGTASVSGSSVAIRPADDLVGQMIVRVRVRDATDDPAREVAATISLTVRGKPATPGAPRIVEVRDRTVVLSWTAPDNRGAPIDEYHVVTSPSTGERTCSSTTCTIDNLNNDTEYTFTVAAHNAVGLSDPSPSSASARPDQMPDAPAAPTLTPGDGYIDAQWTPPSTPGSAITGYTVMVSPGGRTISTSSPSVRIDGLTNGTAYSVQVRAQNRAPQPSGWSPASREVPAGVPGVPQPTATAGNGEIVVSWTPPASNGADIRVYHLLVEWPGGSQTFDPGASERSRILSGVPNGREYTFRLTAENRAGVSDAGVTRATAFGVPAAPAAPTVTPATPSGQQSGNGSVTVTWDAPDANGSAITGYRISVNGGAATDVGPGRSTTLNSLPGGQQVSVQVQACNLRGCGDLSATGTATPVTLPAAPSNPTLTPTAFDATNRPTAATLSWSAADSGGGGTVRYRYSITGWGDDDIPGTSAGTSATVDLSDAHPDSGVVVQISVWAITDVGETPVVVNRPVTWTAPDPAPTGDDPSP